MGMVYAEITLKNAGDESDVFRGHRNEKDIRQTTVTALVDTGAGSLVISEKVCARLGLRIEGERSATLANASRELCKITEPVKIYWKDRFTACPALVIPGTVETLLGAIPLEDMDLIVNPARRELVGAHGDEVVCQIM
jgi:clan AA aspartic protease